MSGRKKARRIGIMIGLIMVLVSVLLIVVTAKTDHYTATVTEITNTYKTRASGNSSKRSFYEDATVIFLNGKGEQTRAEGVRIKRSTKEQLPEVGGTIEVSDGLTGVREYRVLTRYTTGGTLIVVGLMIVIVSFRVGRKKAQISEEPAQDQDGPESA